MIALPVLVPLFIGVLNLLAWRSARLQQTISIGGACLQIVAAAWLLISVQQGGIQHLQVGNWPAPFGIILAADLFSAIMVMVAAAVALVVAVYSHAAIDLRRIKYGYYPLFFFLLMGVNGAFLTGDLFNLYVWFEVMLMASFVMLALGGERPQIEGAIKYVILNLLSSTLFLSAVGLLYNLAGTLNLADLALRLPQLEAANQVTLIAVLFLVAFGIKSAIFPLFFWLPASYHTPPVTITALFSGLLTKVGVYALIRVFTLLFVQDSAYTHTLILVIAGFTMVTGVFGAAAQTDFRRLLSFHIISQIGYLLMGLGLFSQPALAASVYLQMALKPHIVHVVGYVEAHHAATGEDVIASCKLARRAIENALAGQPDMTADPLIQTRRAQLAAEARLTLAAIADLAGSGISDSFTDPATLARAVTHGILDAPQLKNNPFGRGQIATHVINGQCLAVDSNGSPLSETERLEKLNSEEIP